MGYSMKNPGIGKLIRGNILGEQTTFSRVEKKDDQGYRYLNSRFITNAPKNFKNPMSGYGQGPWTQAKQDKFDADRQLKHYYGGNHKHRKSANKDAKISSRNFDIMQKGLYKAGKMYDKNPVKSLRKFEKTMLRVEKRRRKMTSGNFISYNDKRMQKSFARSFLAPQIFGGTFGKTMGSYKKKYGRYLNINPSTANLKSSSVYHQYKLSQGYNKDYLNK